MSIDTIAFGHYCERVGDGFWAEPVNALTNLAFVLTAGLLVQRLRRSGVAARAIADLWLLPVLMAAIGVGSLLWHTLATAWAELADIIPILLFISVFILSFLVRIARLQAVAVLTWFALFHLTNFAVQAALPADLLNRSVFYLPTWVSLWLMVWYCRAAASPAAGWLLAAALVFTLSLLLRTLDNALCGVWPLGTHFGWHLLNAVVLYLASRGLMTGVDPAYGDRAPGPTAVR